MKIVREHINEELKFFKGKSEEEIEKSFDGKSPYYKFNTGINNNVYWLVKDAIDKGYEIKKNDFRALYDAIDRNNIDIVKLLLSSDKINPAGKNNICIQRACIVGAHIDIVKLLLDDGRVDINEKYKGSNAIEAAILFDRTDILKLFLEHPYSRKQLDKDDIERINKYISRNE